MQVRYAYATTKITGNTNAFDLAVAVFTLVGTEHGALVMT
jgi:hypothetical protein